MKHFFKWIIFSYVVIFFILLIFFLSKIINQDFFFISILAIIINLVNSLISVKLYEISYKEKNSIFLLYNFGGSVIRLFILLVIILVIIKFLNIDQYAFIFIFFLFYFISLIHEIVFFIKHREKSKN